MMVKVVEVFMKEYKDRVLIGGLLDLEAGVPYYMIIRENIILGVCKHPPLTCEKGSWLEGATIVSIGCYAGGDKFYFENKSMDVYRSR
jgi:hypothetical protein